MTTQEKTKREILEAMRENREMRKRAIRKRQRRRRLAALITLAVIITVALGTVYSVSAKEIKITEINEFMGVNETHIVKTRSANVEEALEEHGMDIGETDKLNVPAKKPIVDNDDIVITRGKNVTIKVGEREEVVTVTKADVTDALVEAGYIPGEYDQISMNGNTLADGDVIELVSVSYEDETVAEKIERGIDYVDDSTLPKGKEKVIDEGQDGVKEISYKVTYRDGAETERETVSEDITVEVKNKVIARGTAVPTPQPTKATAQSAAGTKSTVSDSSGTVNGYKYKKKITMTATAYSPVASENGGYALTASGTMPGYGVAAVDPNVIPLGSKIYVTSADGSWSYGVASAEDTGGAIKGNRIDLCYDSGASAFGRRSCVVYVLE
ncbi:MAG: G5 domain-containing protein [Oscillospiraceae bacterium]|nr:G5 domain-containing protein [Oscillospiraceae bacterium]